MIFAIFAIYLSAGRVVLQWRRQLLDFAQNHTSDAEISTPRQPASPGIVKTTEIYITTEPIQFSNLNHQLDFKSDQAHLSTKSKHCSTHLNRNPRHSRASVDANSAAVSYCKCALLFFVALLVTWVPSTINRVVSLVHPDDAVFGLNYASGLVLPLQGFWNAVIYIFTSLPACKALIRRTTTVLPGSQSAHTMSQRWRSLLSTTSDTSGNTGREIKNQKASCSESLQELRRNSGDGLGVAM